MRRFVVRSFPLALFIAGFALLVLGVLYLIDSRGGLTEVPWGEPWCRTPRGELPHEAGRRGVVPRRGLPRRERVALPEVGLATWRYLREGRGRGACLGHGDCVEGGPRCRKHLRSNLTLDVEEYGSRRGTDGVETIAEQALDVSSRVVPINTYSNVSRRTRAFRAATQPGAACRAVGGPVLARRPHDPAVSSVSGLPRAHRIDARRRG